MFDWFTAPVGLIFSPLTAFKPHIALFIFTAFITLLITLINRFAVNRKLMKDIKTKMTELRETLTKAQKEGDKENTSKLLNEYMQTNGQYMKQSFKALAISMVVVIIFLPWLGKRYAGMTVASLPFSLPVIGDTVGWLAWYFLVSLAIGWIVRKWLGVD